MRAGAAGVYEATTGLGRYLIAASNWRRMIWLAVQQQLSHYTRGGRFALLVSLLEPLALIAILYLIRGIYRGQSPRFGTSLFLFIATGALPFYLFLRISTRTRQSNVAPGSRLPGLTTLDMYFATVFLNAVIWVTMMVVVFFGIWIYGLPEARPASIATAAAPIFLLIVLGAGVGMINNVIVQYFHPWGWIYSSLTRGMLFLSGVVVIVEFFPVWLRNWCVYIPMVHAIEWFRLGMYGHYPHRLLDRTYLAECAAVALFLGLVLNRATLRKV